MQITRFINAKWLGLAAAAFLGVSLPLPALAAEQAIFSYDAAGNLTSTVQTTSSTGPRITQEPLTQISGTGTQASFSVFATGSEPLTYQWLFNNAAISGATRSTLLIPSVTGTSFGNYSVKVSNSVATVSSGTAQLLLDSDNSGLPNEWQLEYFGSLSQTAEGDYSLDGVENLLKFLEGTNPTDSLATRVTLTLSSIGDVLIQPNLPDYARGQVVTLTAISDSNLKFEGWGGDASGSANPLSIKMDGDTEVTATFTVPLVIALDDPKLTWTTTGDASWFGQAGISHDNISAAQSGSLSALGQSQLITSVTGRGTIGFWWQSSTNPVFNYLSFAIDGQEQARITGSTPWIQESFPVSSGTHQLAWSYVKTAPAGGDADAAWVDQVTYISGSTGSEAVSPVSDISNYGALVSGSLSLSSTDTMVYINYGATTAYGSSTPSQDLGTGSGTVSFGAPLAGLAPNTTYYYQIVEVIGTTTVDGPQETFTTAPLPPEVTTTGATSLASNSATINGTVDPNGATTDFRFDWGTDATYGHSTASQPLGPVQYPYALSANLTNLQPNTTYHYRLVAINAGGSSSGADQSFSTGSTFATLYSFTDGADGANPNAVSQGSDGNLYGTAQAAGVDGVGTVFRLTTSGSFTLLYAFNDEYDDYLTQGAVPIGTLLPGSDGNFWGETSSGGSDNLGTLFNIAPDGTLTTIHWFDGADGSSPRPMLQAADLNYYGVTVSGGLYNYGTVFKMTPSGVYTLLHSFNNSDGTAPYGQLIQGNDGNFYGTTSGGGENGDGSVFNITPSGVFTTLHSFQGSDGSTPYAGLLLGPDGNFYGVTYGGGVANDGTVFKMTPSGTITTLHSFSGSDGQNPAGNGLANGSDGYFYGTTAGGFGSIFRISPDGGSFGTVHFFNNTDGSNPNGGGLTHGSDGNLYGATLSGGQYGYGTVYRLAVATLTASAASNVGFDSATLSGTINPNGTSASAWFVYGLSTDYGSRSPAQNLGSGSNPVNVVANLTGLLPNSIYHYELVETSGTAVYRTADQTFQTTSTSAFTMVYSFSGADGAHPYNGLLQGSDGTLYGTTSAGGGSNDGTVLSMNPGGVLSVFHSFAGYDGASPNWLISDGKGNLYGDTYGGGLDGSGALYRLGTDGSLTLLHNFNGTDGQHADGPVQLDSAGNIYGVAVQGGTNNNNGVFYKLAASGSLTDLVSFTGTNGNSPSTLLAAGGYYYGTTIYGGSSNDGTVFRVGSGGLLTTLHTFTGTDGANPETELTLGKNGDLYGVTDNGGSGDGTVFQITTSGSLTTLHTFNGTDGSSPRLGLIQASSGTLYGTTYSGGANNAGTIFALTLSGSLTTLYSFNGPNGANPYAQLLAAADGSLYGTTLNGGPSNDGTVFRLSVASAPVVAPVAPAVLSSTAVAVAGLANPNGTATSVYFQYGTSLSYGSTTATRSLGSGSATIAINAMLAGLLPNTTYYYRLVEVTSHGTIYEPGQSFTTPPLPPVVTTGTSSGVTSTGATLDATVNPRGAGTLLYFQYGASTAYGAAGEGQQIGAYMNPLQVSSQFTDLIPRTTYHYRAVASNPGGTAFGADMTFTTGTATQFKLAVAVTGTAAVQTSGATLNGSVNPNGSPAFAYFDFGPTMSYGSSTAAQLLGGGSAALPVSASISGLVPGIPYHFRMVATGQGGTVTGTDRIFTSYTPFPHVAGVYNGLVTCPFVSNSTSGIFRASTTAGGAFSASLILGGATYPLSGSFDKNGNYTTTLTTPGGSSLLLSIDIDLATGDQITGTLFDGVNTSEIDAGRCPYTATNPAPQAGSYTVVIQPNLADIGNAFPQGDGFATMSVTKLGAVTVSGKLGDGSPFTASGYVTVDNSFPFYAALYPAPASPGGIQGDITFENLPGQSDCTGSLVWFKPAETANEVIYDAANDFSINSNPSGVWTYGTVDTQSGFVFTPFTTPVTNRDFTGEQIWDNNGTYPNVAGIINNTTGSIATVGTVELPPGLLHLDGENLITDLRWTAPTSGTYNINGLFERDDTGAAPVSVSIVENGTNTLFSAANFTTNGSQQLFSLSQVTIAAGATLDFSETPVQANNDGTGLEAVIARLLMPSSSVGSFYSNGFTTDVSFAGALYSGTTPLTGAKTTIRLDDGDLPSEIVETVPIVSGSAVTLTGTGSEHLKITIYPSTGALTGTFTHPVTSQATTLQGEVLKKADAAGGLFIGPAHTGSVTISPPIP